MTSSPLSSVQMALVSAQQNGDPYPIGETLVVDGITTICAALFGSYALLFSLIPGLFQITCSATH